MLDKNNITTMAKREILFRGKVKGTGEWVYGNLIHRVDESPVQESNELYISDYICEFDAVCLEYEVDSDTVGQYTGMKDAKGVKIFEGDILKLTIPDGSIRHFAVKWGTNERKLMPLDGFEHDGNTIRISGWCFVWNGFPLYPSVINGVADNERMVVVGNVHENQDQELIKTERQ